MPSPAASGHGPAQWVPEARTTVASGEGPEQYVEEVSTRASRYSTGSFSTGS
jgi:hypothetical protein